MLSGLIKKLINKDVCHQFYISQLLIMDLPIPIQISLLVLGLLYCGNIIFLVFLIYNHCSCTCNCNKNERNDIEQNNRIPMIEIEDEC
jgi:hypothetical protein